MKCICILTDGFEELEAVGTLALLRRAGIQIILTIHQERVLFK